MNTEQTESSTQALSQILPDGEQTVVWHSEAGFAAPTSVEYADDTMRADQALKKCAMALACSGAVTSRMAGNCCRRWGAGWIERPKRQPILMSSQLLRAFTGTGCSRRSGHVCLVCY